MLASIHQNSVQAIVPRANEYRWVVGDSVPQVAFYQQYKVPKWRIIPFETNGSISLIYIIVAFQRNPRYIKTVHRILFCFYME